MSKSILKTIKYAKLFILCLLILSSVLIILQEPWILKVQQGFDLRSAVVVSVGFGTALCMFIHNFRKL